MNPTDFEMYQYDDHIPEQYSPEIKCKYIYPVIDHAGIIEEVLGEHLNGYTKGIYSTFSNKCLIEFGKRYFVFDDEGYHHEIIINSIEDIQSPVYNSNRKQLINPQEAAFIKRNYLNIFSINRPNNPVIGLEIVAAWVANVCESSNPFYEGRMDLWKQIKTFFKRGADEESVITILENILGKLTQQVRGNIVNWQWNRVFTEVVNDHVELTVLDDERAIAWMNDNQHKSRYY